MSEAKIQDIPQFQKLLNEVKSLSSLGGATVSAAPILRLFGLDSSRMEKILADAKHIQSMVEEFSAIPDKFNDHFSARGWIIYDLMNVEVAKAAIKKADAGEFDQAELDLVEYYDARNIEKNLTMMHSVVAFRPRIHLARKALNDYREERYHACVPVVLVLLDGMVNELHKRRRGFFSEEIDLQAWDSIAAHNKGLNALTKIFQKSRQTTVIEAISIPYRNGIMHGMDLGYDNKMVAAKSWAALFAARDWATRAEQGLLEAQSAKPNTTWTEVTQKLQTIEDDKRRLAAWVPRSIKFGSDIPESGNPSDFSNGMPEQRLAEFLNYWIVKNFGKMGHCLAFILRKHESENQVGARIRSLYQQRILKRFQFLTYEDEAPAITNIKVSLWLESTDGLDQTEVVARLLYEDSMGSAAVSGKPGCRWGLVNWTLA